MRVIAGSAGGVRLVAPRDPETRPITDRVKETLFGILGERVIDARAIDLYAGSGAIGIEALSRGAVHCTFVERGHDALAALRENLRRAGVEGEAAIIGADVIRALERAEGEEFDLAFLDPPYAERAILPALERLVPLLRVGGTIVVKHFWRSGPPAIADLTSWRERRFGETALTFLERVPPSQPVGEEKP